MFVCEVYITSLSDIPFMESKSTYPQYSSQSMPEVKSLIKAGGRSEDGHY